MGGDRHGRRRGALWDGVWQPTEVAGEVGNVVRAVGGGGGTAGRRDTCFPGRSCVAFARSCTSLRASGCPLGLPERPARFIGSHPLSLCVVGGSVTRLRRNSWEPSEVWGATPVTACAQLSSETLHTHVTMSLRWGGRSSSCRHSCSCFLSPWIPVACP